MMPKLKFINKKWRQSHYYIPLSSFLQSSVHDGDRSTHSNALVILLSNVSFKSLEIPLEMSASGTKHSSKPGFRTLSTTSSAIICSVSIS